MYSNKIFIPKHIRVGYVPRKDTYTQRLAYVIYYDGKGPQNNGKGVLRKETSQMGWIKRNREDNIPQQDFDNIPTSGFVLNKKAGDYKSDWNHRQAYARVYDPRDFEFEITIENLLWVLENADCIKGKGLQGEFVYGWDNGQLLLVPVDSPDYKKIFEFSNNKINPEKISSASLVLGGTYLTSNNEPLVYLGRFEAFQDNKSRGKCYFFSEKSERVIAIKSLSRIIKTVSTEPVYNYADLMDKLQQNRMFSPIDESLSKYIPMTIDEIKKDAGYWRFYPYILVNGQYRQLEIERNYHSSGEHTYDIYLYTGQRYWQENKMRELSNKTINEITEKLTLYKKQLFLKNGQPYKYS